MKDLFATLFWACVFYALLNNAHAQTQPILSVALVHVQGQNALTKERALTLFNEAAKVYEQELGIRLQLKSFRTRSDPFKGRYQTLGTRDRSTLLRLWEGWFRRHNEGSVLRISLLPPVWNNNKYWLAGIANGICTYKGRINPVAYSNGEELNQDGEARFYHSVVGFTHELSHLAGASHDDSNPNIMHPAALNYAASGELHFNYQAKEQIYACINR